MTSQHIPRLSIGLPVFNGQAYLASAIESILAQTYSDFELIISDNASTDDTPAICDEYARRDHRVRVHRNENNIGATQNFYLVHKLSRGELFALAADDDMYDPRYMQACIDVLDRDQDVVVCHSRTRIIDESGAYGRIMCFAGNTTSPFPHDRLHQLLANDYLCIQLYGVMRSAVLARTKVFEGYYSCDSNTLAELCLLGKIAEVPEVIFYHRLYPAALGWIVHAGKSIHEMAAEDPGTDWSKRSTELTVWRNYFGSVQRHVDSPFERARCYVVLFRFVAGALPQRLKRILARVRGY